MSLPLTVAVRRFSAFPLSHSTAISSVASFHHLPSSPFSTSSSPVVGTLSTATYTDSSYSNVSPSSSSASSPSTTAQLLSRVSYSPLSDIESRRSVLDLYRKVCRLLPQVLKGYELEGEDSYHRGLRNLRFHFEHHRQLRDRHVVEVLRHKAEMEIEEALLMYKTKSHVAALLFEEPQLASVARAAKETRGGATSPRSLPSPQSGARGVKGSTTSPSPFLQDFLAGTA